MKCSLLLHTQRVDLGREFVSAESVMTIARAAEAAAFDSVSVTDHPMPHDEWMASGGHHALDPFVALSFAGATLLAVGDLRRGSAFAGVPLHGLERDLVQVQSVQKAVLLTGTLAEARRALPHAGKPAAFNVGESERFRLVLDERGGVTGSVGDAKIPLSGDRRGLDEPPALDLRLPPGVVLASLAVELPVVPKKP